MTIISNARTPLSALAMLSALLVFVLGLTPVKAEVAVPNVFSDGTPARAAEVNENFSFLANGLETLQSSVSALEAYFDYTPTPGNGFRRNHLVIPVDCTESPEAFLEAVDANRAVERAHFVVTGECTLDGRLDFYSRSIIISDSAGAWDSPSLCAGDAKFVGGDRPIFFNIEGKGNLWLSCLTLGEGDDVVTITAADSSMLRLGGLTVSDRLNVRAAYGSYVRIFTPISIEALTLTSASHAELYQWFFTDMAVGTLRVSHDSSAVCRILCTVKIDTLTVTMNSTFLYEQLRTTDLPEIQELNLRGHSRFITAFRSGEADPIINEKNIDETSSLTRARD